MRSAYPSKQVANHYRNEGVSSRCTFKFRIAIGILEIMIDGIGGQSCRSGYGAAFARLIAPCERQGSGEGGFAVGPFTVFVTVDLGYGISGTHDVFRTWGPGNSQPRLKILVVLVVDLIDVLTYTRVKLSRDRKPQNDQTARSVMFQSERIPSSNVRLAHFEVVLKEESGPGADAHFSDRRE